MGAAGEGREGGGGGKGHHVVADSQQISNCVRSRSVFRAAWLGPVGRGEHKAWLGPGQGAVTAVGGPTGDDDIDLKKLEGNLKQDSPAGPGRAYWNRSHSRGTGNKRETSSP